MVASMAFRGQQRIDSACPCDSATCRLISQSAWANTVLLVEDRILRQHAKYDKEAFWADCKSPKGFAGNHVDVGDKEAAGTWAP